MSPIANLPFARPSMHLDFAGAQQLDPRVYAGRASTATYYDSQGVSRSAPVGVPRTCYDPATGRALGILVEEARANFVINSEDFTAASWSLGSGLTRTSGFLLRGRAGAKFAVSGAGSRFIASNSTNAVAGQTYALSCLVQDSGGGVCRLNATNFSTDSRGVTVNLATGVVSVDAAGTVFKVASYRARLLSVGLYEIAVIVEALADTTLRFALDVSSGAVVAAMPQCEAGTYPSSYVPTTSSAVARAADYALLFGPTFLRTFNPAEGTLLVCAQRAEGTAAWMRYCALSDGSMDNELALIHYGPAGGKVGLSVREAGASIVDMVLARPGLPSFKAAVSYGPAGCVVSLDGGTPQYTNKMISIGGLINTLGLGVGGIGAPLSSVVYYPRQLSGSELQRITV